MEDARHDSNDTHSRLSSEDDEIVWSQDSDDFILLHHPLLDTHSLPSTLTDLHGSDGDPSSALENLSLRDTADCSSTSDESSCAAPTHADDLNRGFGKVNCRAGSSGTTSPSSEYYSGTGTPISSYEDASAFISRSISSPIKDKGAELDLLRALIIELGLRPPLALDFPSTLTSARKLLKAEAHVNIKEYVATRHKGQSALLEILKPSKRALRKDIRKGNRVSLQWVKEHGLQVLLTTCFK